MTYTYIQVRKTFMSEKDCRRDLLIHSVRVNSDQEESVRQNIVSRKLKKLWGREYLDRHVSTRDATSCTKEKSNKKQDKIDLLENYLEQRLCGSTFRRCSSEPKYSELQVGALNREEWGSESYFNASISAQRIVLSDSELKTSIDTCNTKKLRLGSRVRVFQSKLGIDDGHDDEVNDVKKREIIPKTIQKRRTTKTPTVIPVSGVVEELEIPSKSRQLFCCAEKKWKINFPGNYEISYTKIPRTSNHSFFFFLLTLPHTYHNKITYTTIYAP